MEGDIGLVLGPREPIERCPGIAILPGPRFHTRTMDYEVRAMDHSIDSLFDTLRLWGSLLVSPHADDAAMNLCMTLRLRRWLLPSPVVLTTVFSDSDHIGKRSFPLPKRFIKEMRKAEDECFCRAFGITYRPLGLKDIRLSGNVSGVVERVRDSLLDVMERHGCSCVVCPHPYGENVHPHHRLVHLAVSELIRNGDGKVLVFSDDLPYSTLPLESKVASGGIAYSPKIVEFSASEMKGKIRFLRECYTTQMRNEYLRAIRIRSPRDSRRFRETLWLPETLKTRISDRPARGTSFRATACAEYRVS